LCVAITLQLILLVEVRIIFALRLPAAHIADSGISGLGQASQKIHPTVLHLDVLLSTATWRQQSLMRSQSGKNALLLGEELNPDRMSTIFVAICSRDE